MASDMSNVQDIAGLDDDLYSGYNDDNPALADDVSVRYTHIPSFVTQRFFFVLAK
jgi:hypothetical protein